MAEMERKRSMGRRQWGYNLAFNNVPHGTKISQEQLDHETSLNTRWDKPSFIVQQWSLKQPELGQNFHKGADVRLQLFPLSYLLKLAAPLASLNAWIYFINNLTPRWSLQNILDVAWTIVKKEPRIPRHSLSAVRLRPSELIQRERSSDKSSKVTKYSILKAKTERIHRPINERCSIHAKSLSYDPSQEL